MSTTIHQTRTEYAGEGFSHLAVQESNGHFSILTAASMFGRAEQMTTFLTKAQWAELAEVAQRIATSDDTKDANGVDTVMLNEDVLAWQEKNRQAKA